MWGLFSVSCILTTVSISFSLPFHIVDVSQSELENKSVFVNEIQLFGYDGVHKSSESSPLEFSQIEIKYSSFSSLMVLDFFHLKGFLRPHI